LRLKVATFVPLTSINLNGIITAIATGTLVLFITATTRN